MGSMVGFNIVRIPGEPGGCPERCARIHHRSPVRRWTQVLNRPSVKALSRLPLNVDPCVENGEFHRLAFDGPTFNNPVGSPLARSLSLLFLVLACCRSNEMDGRWIFPKPRLMALIAMVLVLSAA
jgi:hypothetical protein